MRQPEFLQPRNLAQLAGALGQTTSFSRLIAGGTDLMLRWQHRTDFPDMLIDLTRVEGMQGVRRTGSRITVGAATCMREIAANPLLQQKAACLAQAAWSVGSVQVRNLATLGGNVANASPCADTIPALLVLEADVGMLQKDGTTRRCPLPDVLELARQGQLRQDEVLLDFSFDALPDGHRSAFVKLGARSAVTMAKLNASIVIHCETETKSGAGHGEPAARITFARLAFGSLAPVARLEPECAGVLLGQRLDDEAAREFAGACTAMVDHAIPGRPSRGYKRMAVQGLAHDLFDILRHSTAGS